jgi:peptidoglycan/xylan/chitin deacetylase (PgdA/CDA1 family)
MAFIKANTAIAIIIGAGVIAALTIAGAVAFSGNSKPAATSKPNTTKSQTNDKSAKNDTKSDDQNVASTNDTDSTVTGSSVTGDVAVTNPTNVASSDVNQAPVSGAIVASVNSPAASGDANGSNGGNGNGSSTPTNPVTPPVTPATPGVFTPKTANLAADPAVATDPTTAASPAYTNYVDNVNASQYTFSFQNAAGQDGTNGFLRTEMTGANTNRYGATTYGSWSPTAVTVPNNSTPQLFAYSMWYRSDVDTEVDAAIQLADGTYIYPVLGRPLATNGEWKQFSASFYVPAGAQNVTASALILTHGTLDTDSFYLGTFTPTALTGGAMISLTFDDGWASIYNNARPILNANQLVSTQYVISGVLNTTDYMTNQQVLDFKADGSEIGDHTVNHIPLTNKAALTTNSTSVTNEIKGNKDALVALGITPTDFASPEGEYDTETINALQAAGIQTHRSVEQGYNSPDAGIFNPYDIKVQNITRATTVADVQSWIDEAKATNTWLVIVYHEVNDTPVESIAGTTTDNQYWTPVADFTAQIAAIKASNVQVVTMTDALAKINAQL